tara:strand:- start:63 stop:212 length:150 start_codon:yes stop_codon:yes gene_type:complete
LTVLLSFLQGKISANIARVKASEENVKIAQEKVLVILHFAKFADQNYFC